MDFIYFDASCGVSGDMFAGALIDLGADFGKAKAAVENLGLGLRLEKTAVNKAGIQAVKFTVIDEKTGKNAEEVCGGEHRNFNDIKKLINNSTLEAGVKADVIAIFQLIAEAEACVHGAGVEEIHFHEVGAADSIADIVAGAVLFASLGVTAHSSPINTGSGTVLCQHGRLPVPAPAATELLKGLPAYSDGTDGELATPTGIALLKYFSQNFGAMPIMIIDRTGYGAGTKELARPNVFRAIGGVKQ